MSSSNATFSFEQLSDELNSFVFKKGEEFLEAQAKPKRHSFWDGDFISDPEKRPPLEDLEDINDYVVRIYEETCDYPRTIYLSRSEMNSVMSSLNSDRRYMPNNGFLDIQVYTAAGPVQLRCVPPALDHVQVNISFLGF